jgi:CRP-like cAMP-binding protein
MEKFRSLTQVFPEFTDIMEPLLRERTSNTLKTFPMFSDLAKETRDLVGEMLQFNSFPKGMNVMTDGMKDDGLHLLIDGQVEVTKIGAEDGKTYELGVVEKGSTIGELSLLAGINRTATLTALEPCRTLSMSQVNCRALFSVAPELMDKMVDLGRERRQKTVEAMGEANANIPRIDETKESKLRL